MLYIYAIVKCEVNHALVLCKIVLEHIHKPYKMITMFCFMMLVPLYFTELSFRDPVFYSKYFAIVVKT